MYCKSRKLKHADYIYTVYAYACYVHCTMYIYDDIYIVEMIPYVSWEHPVSQTSSGNSSQVVGKA